MGTPLGEVLDEIGGGPRGGRQIKAVLSGVANSIIPGSLLDTPVTTKAWSPSAAAWVRQVSWCSTTPST